MELVLNTYGVSLNRENEAFIVTSSEGRQRVPTTGITSIHISKGAQITSDAVLLAVENEIEILFTDKGGNVIGRVWSPKYGSISTIRKGQLAFTFSHDALVWIKQVISRKIENQEALISIISSIAGEDAAAANLVSKAVNRLEDYRKKVESIEGEIVQDVASTLRGWEGVASKIYFSAMNQFIPEEYRFESRSQHPAMDLTNAMLNYGYGLLYGKIESALIKAGIDPYVGIMHRDDYNRPVLAYDVIELYRVWIDYVVYTLIQSNAFSDEMYSVRDDKSYWLEPLGRRILIQSVNDYMEETVKMGGVTRSRMTQMYLYVQDLAQKFKKYN